MTDTAQIPIKRRGNPNWQKGVSGNPSGRNDKPVAILARSHAPHAIRTLARISRDETAPHAAQVMASNAILDRAYGKPPSFSTSDAEAFRKAVDLSDDELATIAATQLKLVVNNK